MATVVQAKCPGCKNTLNIPSDWVSQAVRCKHCGMILQAKSPPRPSGASAAVSSRTPPPVSHKIKAAAALPPPAGTAPAAPPLAVTIAPAAPGAVYPQAVPAPAAIPLAVTAVPVAASAASPFDAIDGDETSPAAALPSRYRRNRGGWWKGPAVAVGVLMVAVVVAFLAWPYIRGAFQLPAAGVAQVEPTQPDRPAETPKPPEAPVRPKDPPRAKDKDVRPSDPPGKDKSSGSKDKPAVASKDKDPKPVDTRPPPDQPKGAPPFPRRALVISVQNYLYANPIHAGMPIPTARNIPNFLDALNRGLHFPMTQMAQLSDGAPRFARPPMKDVIQKTLTGFLDGSRGQDRIMVFFIGHAVTIGDEMYLAPIEGELDNAETLIPLKWVYEQMAKCKARQKVLVMDVNRLNPAHGLERPNGGAMDLKADKALLAPPDGVQVWTACLADQQSYELDDAPEGVFLDKLYTALAPKQGEKGLEGKIQRPDDPLPLQQLCDLVNASLKEELGPKLEQQSRLSGAEAKDGAPFDRNEEPAPAIALAPAPTGSSAKDIQSVLDEVGTPSIKSSREDSGIHFDVLPPFAQEKLADYKPGGDDSDLRKAVLQARAVMWALNTAKAPDMLTNEIAKVRKNLEGVNINVMKDGYRKPADEAKFKESVRKDEQQVADMMQVCDDALAALKVADVAAARDKETKRWQANYDFTLARLDAQYAYLFEYQSMLGQMRKALPDLAPGQTGWKLASVTTLKGDSQGKKLAKESTKLLEKIVKDNPGTPWEVLAKREKLTALGLEWVAY